jgi:hypothetical protein
MALKGGSIMRLWNTLHTLYRHKLAGLRAARHKGIRRAERARTRLEVEALDQRLLPSTIPNLGGVTMGFYPGPGGNFNPLSGNNTLAIGSVQDQGGGKGTFVGVYADGTAPRNRGAGYLHLSLSAGGSALSNISCHISSTYRKLLIHSGSAVRAKNQGFWPSTVAWGGTTPIAAMAS